MSSILDLSASDILKIPQTDPEKLYKKDHLKQQFQQLTSKWHPDRNNDPLADKTFAHIRLLYDKAQVHISENNWNGPAAITFTAIDSTLYQFKYRKIVDISIGKLYIGSRKLMYVIRPEFEDLFKNGVKQLYNIKYENGDIKEQFEPLIPKLLKSLETDIGFVAVFEKTEDVVRLRDVLDYVPDNKLDPKHVAWIMSCMCNIACFLEYNNIAHGAISVDNVWISPQNHTCLLLDGWWYTKTDGEKISALPANLIPVYPTNIFIDKKANMSYDRSLIKAMGLVLLGDSSRTGSMLLTNKEIPSVVLNWLRSTNASSAVQEYNNWITARDTGFGTRKFIKLDITNIY